MPKPVINEQSVVRIKQKRKVFFGAILLLVLISASVAVYHYLKPLPAGISHEGDIHSSGQVEFLYDLTYENEGDVTHNQVIFDQIDTMIDEAREFILMDMFLFNDEYDRSASYPALSWSLMEALIDKKQQD
ncbi:hypothetical protein [Metabacillus idriensis]|uniref:hypothetical protein n=1 Tax=Metabacillus idriensis TaxID=324768 RepID=UPI003D281B3A